MDIDLLSRWNWDPSIVGGIAVLALVYVVWLARTGVASPVSRWQIASYYGGLLILALALVSPLDVLADRYLFTAHMLQHVLLLFVVPPLMIWGLPESLLGQIQANVPVGSSIRKLTGPLSALALYVGLMWIWHAPTFYEAALENEAIHAGEHLCFLGSAALFWWPLVRPGLSFGEMPELIRLAYLFGAALGSTALAALITFAGTVLYPTYALGPPYSAVQDALGMSPLVDQQVGGLLMWIGGGIWYLGAGAIIFFRWFDGPAEDEPDFIDRVTVQGNGVTT